MQVMKGAGGKLQTSHEQIRVVIVDDHSGVRAGIRYLLVKAKDIEVVGEAADHWTILPAVAGNGLLPLRNQAQI